MKSIKEFDTSRRVHLHNFLNKINFRVARTKEELEDAAALVHREYAKKGYTKKSNSRLRLAIYNAHPNTTTFIAKAGNEVIATATVIPDSPLGLPMDEVYRDELNQMRKENKKLCEISMLASDTELFNDGISMMLNSKKLFLVFSLFKHIFDYTRECLKPDYICLTINPRHKLTYDFLRCKDLGGVKAYRGVNEAPAVAKYVDLNSIEKEYKTEDMKGLYKMFFQRKTDFTKFANRYTYSFRDLKYFFVEKTDILKSASPSKRDYLAKCYPFYDFSELLSNNSSNKSHPEGSVHWWETDGKVKTVRPCLSFQH